MKVLHRVFDFYLDASMHVALSVFCMLQITGLLFQFTIDPNLSYFLFFGTIASYNFIKYGVEAEKYIVLANRYHKNIQFFSFIALAIAVYHAFSLPMRAWEYIAILVALNGLYALPVLPHTRNLRSFGGIKIFVVSLVWAGATVQLPIILKMETLDWDVWIETAQRFLFVLVLMIPFEIRDLQYDAADLRTLPQRLGATNTKILGGFLAVLLFVLTYFKDHLSSLDLIGKGILFLSLNFAMLFTRRRQSKYYASFWVEALPVGYYISLLILDYWF